MESLKSFINFFRAGRRNTYIIDIEVWCYATIGIWVNFATYSIGLAFKYSIEAFYTECFSRNAMFLDITPLLVFRAAVFNWHTSFKFL